MYSFRDTILRVHLKPANSREQTGGKMIKNRKQILIGMVLSAVLLSAACTAAEPAEPTADLSAIKTEAVKTAMAEMTVQAALSSPTETDVPATMTPLPTATLDTEAAQPVAGATSSGGGGGSSGTAIPTWTPVVYGCEYVTQSPLDGPQTSGWNYDFRITMRNVGSATWTTNDYYIKWYDDPTNDDDINLSPRNIYKLPHDVAPYETVEILIDIQVPTTPITVPGWISNWRIVNDNGEEFCKFYHQVTMSLTPVPTRTATP